MFATCKNGAQYKCQKIIVTIPLAILKSNMITFKPALPDDLRQSINVIGIGKMDKLIIEFEKSFWDMSVDWFNFINENPGDWARL